MKHPPGEDLVVVFSDETADDRDHERMTAFVTELRQVSQRYGFDASVWGTKAQTRPFTAPEEL